LLGSWASGSSLVLVCFSIIGVVAIRRLFDAIPEVDPRAGRIAATVFALHPYLIGDKLMRNANAEFAALCLLPFVLEGLLLLDRRPLRGAIVITGGLAGVALSQNLTMLFALALLVGGTLCFTVGEVRCACGPRWHRVWRSVCWLRPSPCCPR
jgi:hypothetical protein